MSEQMWTITGANGAVLAPCFITSPAGQHPKDAGWAWDAAVQKATKIAARPDTAVQVWNGSAWADDPAKVEALLVADLKAEGERRKMLLLSSGGAKKTEYAEKGAEVRFYLSLGGSLTAILVALNAMSATDKAARFPYALASSAAFGDTIPAAIARFQRGLTASSSVPALSAVEEKGCAAIRAATTVAAKRAAAAAITWPA